MDITDAPEDRRDPDTIAQLATELDLTLEEIAEYNIDKLYSRLERGTIKGDGDER